MLGWKAQQPWTRRRGSRCSRCWRRCHGWAISTSQELIFPPLSIRLFLARADSVSRWCHSITYQAIWQDWTFPPSEHLFLSSWHRLFYSAFCIMLISFYHVDTNPYHRNESVLRPPVTFGKDYNAHWGGRRWAGWYFTHQCLHSNL